MMGAMLSYSELSVTAMATPECFLYLLILSPTLCCTNPVPLGFFRQTHCLLDSSTRMLCKTC